MTEKERLMQEIQQADEARINALAEIQNIQKRKDKYEKMISEEIQSVVTQSVASTYLQLDNISDNLRLSNEEAQRLRVDMNEKLESVDSKLKQLSNQIEDNSAVVDLYEEKVRVLREEFREEELELIAKREKITKDIQRLQGKKQRLFLYWIIAYILVLILGYATIFTSLKFILP